MPASDENMRRRWCSVVPRLRARAPTSRDAEGSAASSDSTASTAELSAAIMRVVLLVAPSLRADRPQSPMRSRQFAGHRCASERRRRCGGMSGSSAEMCAVDGQGPWWRHITATPSMRAEDGREVVVATLGVRASSVGFEGVAHGDELGLRLGELGVGVGAGDQAAAGVEPQPRAVGLDRGAAQRDAELAVAVRRRPSRPGRRSGRGPCPRARGSPRTRARSACRTPRRWGAARPRARAPTSRRPARRSRRWRGAARWPGAAGAAWAVRRDPCSAPRARAATDCTAYSCSAWSFAESSSAEASDASLSAFDERRIVPASTREVTVSPMRRTSISGVEPSRPSTEKVQHEG